MSHATTRMKSLAPLLVMLALAACDDDPAASSATTSAPDATAPDVPDDVLALDPGAFAVGPSACCLTMQGERAIWAENGDIWMMRLDTGHKSVLVAAPGEQRDPVLDGDRLVWADRRGGDFDLWTLTFSGDVPGEPVLLRGGRGDQDQPAISGTRVVWIGRDREPYSALEAEVYTMDLAVADSERRLTNDGAEQTQPDIDGDRIVWADYSPSPDLRYLDINDPLRNNADILGFDLATNTAFTMTNDPSKQLRPAIDKDVVAWLDWRGINPEPKYSEFQVFVRRIGEPVERRLAWSSWSRPDLWKRPAVADGVVLFIAEPSALGAGVTSVLAVDADGGEPWLVAGSSSVLDSVVTDGISAAWIGGGHLGRKALAPR